MATQRITKKLVDSLVPRSAEYTVWDSDLRGYGVRVRPNRAMSYIAVYRAGNGRKAPVRKLTLAAVGKVTPDEARALARRALASAAHGHDPAAEKAASRQAMTASELAEAFLAEHVIPKRKAKTAEGYTRAVRGHIIPELGAVKADQLSRAAVAKLPQIGIPHGRTRHCPVAALQAWLSQSGIVSGPIFRPVDRHNHVQAERLSGEAVSLVIRDRLDAIGIDATRYSGHSLRAGFATSAARAGVPSMKIRAQTGHASDAMLNRYVRDGELFIGNAAGTLL